MREAGDVAKSHQPRLEFVAGARRLPLFEPSERDPMAIRFSGESSPIFSSSLLFKQAAFGFRLRSMDT